MSSTPAVYPTSLVTFTTKVNHVDVVNDDDVNKLQNEVIAMQTYFGTNPQGNKADLTTRLAQLMATNGAIVQGVAFPTNPVEGQLFWRVDLTTMYVYGNSAWNAQGQSFSNYLFQYSGSVVPSSLYGEVVATGSLDVATAPRLRYLRAPSSGVYGTVWTSKFKKVSGINTITVYANIWQAGAVNAIIRVNVGGVLGTGVGAGAMTAPEWVAFSLNVSGLGANTFYDVIAELTSTGGTNLAFCGNIIGFGS